MKLEPRTSNPAAGGENLEPSRRRLDPLLGVVREACREAYGKRLVTLAVFGSVAAGTAGPDSDVDLLLVADPLPSGRMSRVREFLRIENRCAGVLGVLSSAGVHTVLSPVFKTPGEVAEGSPLFLDMTDRVRILVDEGEFFQRYLEGLKSRMAALGSRRVALGEGYYWDLKPGRKPGEEIRL